MFFPRYSVKTRNLEVIGDVKHSGEAFKDDRVEIEL
jgi:hypothetical protein